MKFSDEKYMKMALALARRAEGRTSPNPMVGCVIVKNGRVVSAGYHAVCGGPHAESVAVEKLLKTSAGRRKLKGAALYVNLEPCRHTKKRTPPCVPLIIKSGIKKLVAGMKDPNPSVNGRGFADLKRAGIEVVRGVLENECRELNKVYVKNITAKLPYVIIKSAMTLDGKTASFKGDSKWISSPASREIVHRLRSRSDAVLVGGGTVRADNPRLNVRLNVVSAKNPARVVVSPSGNLPRRAHIFDGKARTLIVTSERGAARLSGLDAEFVVLKKASGGSFDFKKILKELYRRGIRSVLAEGGGDINWSAVKSGSVDEYWFFIAPMILGGVGAKTPVDGEGFAKVSSALGLKIKKTFMSGGDIVVAAAPVPVKRHDRFFRIPFPVYRLPLS